jgi:hypothetical protein
VIMDTFYGGAISLLDDLDSEHTSSSR